MKFVCSCSTHPKEGPRNGISTRKAIGIARSCGTQISAIVPAETLRTGLPKTPARNLQIVIAAILWDRPAPRVNRAKRKRYGA